MCTLAPWVSLPPRRPVAANGASCPKAVAEGVGLGDTSMALVVGGGGGK